MNSCRFASIFAILLTFQLGGCLSSPHVTPKPSSAESAKLLTASQAKQALIELVRANPTMFIGSPDPEMLAGLPLLDRGSGEFALGAFVMNLDKRWYSADIGRDSPEMYSYSGSFEWNDDKWVAAEPQVSRFHQLPKDGPSE